MGQLKAKLAKLRRELIDPKSGGGGGGGGIGFDVARTGVASVGFVGFPSVGKVGVTSGSDSTGVFTQRKSTLMTRLTGTHSEVSEIEFTTLTTVPGTLKVHGAPIQILDLRMPETFPLFRGLIILQLESSRERTMAGVEDARSSQVCPFPPPTTILLTTPSELVARTCNLIFIILDVLKPLGDKKVIESELEGFGIRLNKKPPAIIVRKKDKGGIAIMNTVPLTNIDHDEIKAILSEYRISNADVAIRQPNATADDLVDVVEGNRVYIPAIYVSNAHTNTSFVVPNLLHPGSEQGTH